MRTALISPLQVFTLAIQNHTHNEHLSNAGAESYELQPLVYSSLIQAGLEKLVFSSDTKMSEDFPAHVASRIQVEDALDYQSCIGLASTILTEESKQAEDSARKNDLPLLWGFIGELLFSLRTRRPIVTFFDIPTEQNTTPFLPPQLSIPISNLLGQLNETSVGTGTPAMVASVHDVALCEEILADEFYRSYMAKHAALEGTDDRLDVLAKAIEADVQSMASRHRQLRFEKVGISTLKLSSKLIDKVLLGIPGKLGNELAAAAAEYLEDRQRIVIYKFMDIPRKVFAARMAYAMSSRASAEAPGAVLPNLAVPGALRDKAAQRP
jgi:hypothetical protein